MAEVRSSAAGHRQTDCGMLASNVSVGDSHLVKPRLKPYYQHGMGSKSVGEPDWKPHPCNALSHACQNSRLGGNNGLDWFSSLRCAPLSPVKTIKRTQQPQQYSTTPQRIAVDVGADNPLEDHNQRLNDKRLHSLKSRELNQHSVEDEFHRIYYRYPIEITLRMAMGAKMKVCESRNGLPTASLGDKNYQVPEYSDGFHKQGCTLPVVSFGGTLECVADTFVPLQDLPLNPQPTFEERETHLKKMKEVQEIIDLDNWKPAQKLVPATSHF